MHCGRATLRFGLLEDRPRCTTSPWCPLDRLPAAPPPHRLLLPHRSRAPPAAVGSTAVAPARATATIRRTGAERPCG
eukprot:12260212-Heterocapsa_arctica.AAC.1